MVETSSGVGMFVISKFVASTAPAPIAPVATVVMFSLII